MKNNIDNNQSNRVRILMVKSNELLIGYLMKQEGVGYLFKYDKEGISEARQRGYRYLIGFKDLRKTYVSEHLFPAFLSRIPTKQRRDLQDKLASFGIEKYDEFDYLVASKGKLLTDAISVEEFTPEKMLENSKRKQTLKITYTATGTSVPGINNSMGEPVYGREY